MLKNPSLEELDQIRNQGFRPQVVGCFLCKKKILFLFKEKYNLWQLPQGGIDNQENIKQAVIREMTEELGENFINNNINEDIKLEITNQEKIEFPNKTKGSRELYNDQGDKIFMEGKIYFFVIIKINNFNLNIQETEFDDHKWLTIEESFNLVNRIHQKGKKRITLNFLKVLESV